MTDASDKNKCIRLQLTNARKKVNSQEEGIYLNNAVISV